MATEAPTRPPKEINKETWVDWVKDGAPDPSPEDLITRDELIDRLREAGIPITTRELRYWETEGALPRPVKRSHTGAIRAVYPTWVLRLIPRLRTLRHQGVPLPEIAAHLRLMLRGEEGAKEAKQDMLYWSAPTLTPHLGAYDIDPDNPAAWESTREAVQTSLGFTSGDLGATLEQRARDHREATGKAIASIDIVFRDSDGRALATMTHYLDQE
ncbi:MAG: MerR family transcriptional regulator [Chloroflexota bacterium]|nr:MerR family transcriptional regulator [Chloroflexota bacterium]